MKKTILSLAVLIFLAWGCEEDRVTYPIEPGPEIPKDTTTVRGTVLSEFKDIDNNIYHAIQIGDQIWSQENLRTIHYNDGTPISCVRSSIQWEALTSEGYCYYNNDKSYSNEYGLLYNHYAAVSDKIAPEGWHVATSEDWKKLMTNVKNKVGFLLDANDWQTTFNDPRGNIIPCTNCSKFTALPNGYRDVEEARMWGSEESFMSLGFEATWWTSTENTITYLSSNFSQISNRPNHIGSGIRLVKDADVSIDDDPGDQEQVSGSSEFKDIDGNVYPAIKIGDQILSMENLRTTHYNDGTPIHRGTGDMAGETDWFDLRSGAYCWYFNDTGNKTMGAIYNWFAIETGKLAPKGWHVPTETEWRTLINYLGGETPAHTKLISSGTNESGFSAVSSPILCGWGFLTELAFWSSTPYQNSNYRVPYANYFSIWEENSVGKVKLFSEPQSSGLCVRCLKDNNSQ